MNRKIQKSALNVETVFTEQQLLKNHVEKMADQSYARGCGHVKIQPGFTAIETSSLEVYVKVEINISDNIECININYVSNFIFTCIKNTNADYKLQWSSSLS